jgi:hypothetical protein
MRCIRAFVVAVLPTYANENYPDIWSLYMATIRTTANHPDGFQDSPWYEIKQHKIYPTVFHPDGWSGLPMYEIKGNKIYPAVSHPNGWSDLPWYEIKGDKINCAGSHPQGQQSLPWYEIVSSLQPHRHYLPGQSFFFG